MNVSEYMIDFFEKRGVRDFFGYQGTMIAYFIEAICTNPRVRNHSCYNEQGAAFAACGYAKASGNCAVAYATSGPGALNLISGIADAYYDSVPVVFITGQLNTNEYTDVKELRQQGFQQTDVTGIAGPITKYSVMLTDADDVPRELEKAWMTANSGRKGPVLLDIPMNIQRAEIGKAPPEAACEPEIVQDIPELASEITEMLNRSERPVLLLGNGIGKDQASRENGKKLVNYLKIPVITSMLGIDLLESRSRYNFGYYGAAYGFRAANIIMYKKADFILSIGCSMCRRQTGLRTEEFAKDAKIVRVDIDGTELRRKVHKNEKSYIADADLLIARLLDKRPGIKDFTEWVNICNICREKTEEFDDRCRERDPNRLLAAVSDALTGKAVIAVDVGQHQVWASQSFESRDGRRILFSGGHGAMGFSLPAAIGAYYSTGLKPVCIAGDGAFQMNIQELQWVSREQIPVTIFVLNNNVLGLITQQQDDFLGARHYGSSAQGGFCSPDFRAVAEAYGIDSYRVGSAGEISGLADKINGNSPVLIEVKLPSDTKAYPKTYFGQEMFDQKPYLPQDIMDYLLSL